MNIILFYATSIFFFIQIAASALTWISVFEERAWSLKRLFIYLKETKKGRSMLFSLSAVLKWIAIFSYFLTIFITEYDFYFHVFVFVIYALSALKVLKTIIDRDFRMPRLAFSNYLVFLLTLALVVVLYVFPPLDRYLWMLLIDKMLPFFLALFFILISVFFDFSDDPILNRALDKMRKHKKLLTIAVVGSYGRGTTKEFISRILSLKYKVLVSRGSYNSSLDIAKSINSSLTTEKQIFIAEIDDYKKEDVNEMCGLINPQIVVISGINEQKLSYFGSQEAIVESKFEAIESMGRDGIALFNGSSNYVQDIYARTKSKKFMLQVGKGKNHTDILATNIKIDKFSVSFDVIIQGKRYKLANIRLLGYQSIENLLPAIFIGTYAGIDFSKIRQELSKIRPLQGAMVPRKMKNGVVLIDDTYNANINSVRRILSYMELYKGQKVFVFEPLSELGKNARKIHLELGREIGKVCDFAFFTNDNYYKELSEGIKKSKSSCIYGVWSPAKIINFVNKNVPRESVVVFEGRGSLKALSGIKSERIY